MKRNQRGQVTVELVLIMTVLVAVALLVRRTVFLDGEFAEKMVSGPWDRVSGMIESGSFGKPANSIASHPGRKERHLSMKGNPE